ncbi:hypothetical protein TKK_0004786 [Trichogramma kaykai]|uniref:BTB domain-containing protein n=1 Tax=Trichogramma kaykai TaxID=54128 RepID=A0ABD2XJB8_9HYME
MADGTHRHRNPSSSSSLSSSSSSNRRHVKFQRRRSNNSGSNGNSSNNAQSQRYNYQQQQQYSRSCRPIGSSNKNSDDNNNNNDNKDNAKTCVCLPDDYAPKEFPSVWSELRAKEQLCDGVIICADGAYHRIHRAILSAASPYFRALFTDCLRSSSSSSDANQRTIRLEDQSHELVGDLLDYCYRGQCRVTARNVERLLPLADRLGVVGCVRLCCRFLVQQLRPDNCLGVRRFAGCYFCRGLEAKCRDYVLGNLGAILRQSREFLELDSGELLLILADDELQAPGEELVFEACRVWLEADPRARARDLARVLAGSVRWGLMRPEYFRARVETWEPARRSRQCCKSVLGPARRYLEAETRDRRRRLLLAAESATWTRPRVPHEILFAIGGWTSGSPTNFVETYDTSVGKVPASTTDDRSLIISTL